MITLEKIKQKLIDRGIEFENPLSLDEKVEIKLLNYKITISVINSRLIIKRLINDQLNVISKDTSYINLDEELSKYIPGYNK